MGLIYWQHHIATRMQPGHAASPKPSFCSKPNHPLRVQAARAILTSRCNTHPSAPPIPLRCVPVEELLFYGCTSGPTPHTNHPPHHRSRGHLPAWLKPFVTLAPPHTPQSPPFHQASGAYINLYGDIPTSNLKHASESPHTSSTPASSTQHPCRFSPTQEAATAPYPTPQNPRMPPHNPFVRPPPFFLWWGLLHGPVTRSSARA
jgi:hypothetical protein